MGERQAPGRIVITATGIITALGTGRPEHLLKLVRGESGLSHPRILTTRHASDFVVAETPHSNVALFERLASDANATGFSRTALLSMCALGELLTEAGPGLPRDERLGFINANTVGGMTEIERLYPFFISPERRDADDPWLDALDCADSTERAARFFGLAPQWATISTACSSSANAILLGARMLQHGLVDAAITGGGDALSRFTLNGFHALKNVDRNPCRPFDRDRNGLNLGEGAGYLLLEREADAIRRGASVLAVLSGWSNRNDAYHPTAPSPDGSAAARTMTGALRMAGLSAADIGYINAHGTATINNDPAEGKAIRSIWPDTAPPFSSTKPFTGHTLAAAGVVESIISIISMQSGIVPPSLNFETPMDEIDVVPSGLLEGIQMQHVMTNSFGFGGNNATLIFSQP